MNIRSLMFDVRNFLLDRFFAIKKVMMGLMTRLLGCAFLILGSLVFVFSVIIGAVELVYFHISRNYFNRKPQKNLNSRHTNFVTRL